MKKNRLLILTLHRVFVVSFWFLIVFFLLVVTNRLYPHEITFGDRWVEKEPEGFALPIDFQLRVPDSIVSYHAVDSMGISSGITNHYTKDRYRIPEEAANKIDSLSKLPHVDKNIIRNDIDFHLGTEPDTNIEHTSSSIDLTGTIRVKTSKNWINTIMRLSQLLKLILSILILYQLKGIFYQLKQSLSFNIKIIQRVKWLGLILIFSELMNAGRSYYMRSFTDYIDIYSYNNGSMISSGLRTQIYPMITFEWSIFIVGCSLLVLSSLLRLGNTIEAENELTI